MSLVEKGRKKNIGEGKNEGGGESGREIMGKKKKVKRLERGKRGEGKATRFVILQGNLVRDTIKGH